MSEQIEETAEERHQRIEDGAILLTGLIGGLIYEALDVVEVTPNHLTILMKDQIKYHVSVQEARVE